MAEIQRVATNAKLAGFEIPRRILVDTTPFSVEEGLLTPTFKLKRGAVQSKYLDQLKALYASEAPKMQSGATTSKL